MATEFPPEKDLQPMTARQTGKSRMQQLMMRMYIRRMRLKRQVLVCRALYPDVWAHIDDVKDAVRCLRDHSVRC